MQSPTGRTLPSLWDRIREPAFSWHSRMRPVSLGAVTASAGPRYFLLNGGCLFVVRLYLSDVRSSFFHHFSVSGGSIVFRFSQEQLVELLLKCVVEWLDLPFRRHHVFFRASVSFALLPCLTSFPEGEAARVGEQTRRGNKGGIPKACGCSVTSTWISHTN